MTSRLGTRPPGYFEYVGESFPIQTMLLGLDEARALEVAYLARVLSLHWCWYASMLMVPTRSLKLGLGSVFRDRVLNVFCSPSSGGWRVYLNPAWAPNYLLRSTSDLTYGGSRAGARFGGSRGLPRWRSKRSMW